MKAIAAITVWLVAAAAAIFSVAMILANPSVLEAWYLLGFSAFLVLVGAVVWRKGVRGVAGAIYDGHPDADKLK